MSNRRIILPKWIRLRDAPAYLGMDRNRFNREVRPRITTIPIGKQGIAFDRLELDAWAECTKQRTAHSKGSPMRRTATWEQEEYQDSTNAKTSGTSTKHYWDKEFAKALAQATSKKPKPI